jgi:2-haloacid dehalogenase
LIAVRLSDFKVLSFDCYGTLIDWESGIYGALRPLLEKANLALDRDHVLETFAKFEATQQAATPSMPYSRLLGEVYAKLASHWGLLATTEAAAQFGGSVPAWPAFPDSAESLAYLKQHYTLVILSNVDRVSFAGSNRHLQVTFDEIFTAEDIGSYKPDPRNFETMLRRLRTRGYKKSDILHTAQSLFHDHVPATEVGLATAWIDRRQGQAGWGATPPPPREARIDFHFRSLEDLVERHRAEMDR